jgi:folate-binding protein YgfZ
VNGWADVLTRAGANLVGVGPCKVAADFGDPPAEYATMKNAAGIYPASLRGVIEIGGRDRATWLNNLVTNVVKALPPGAGRYAYAADRKGRILADFNILVRPEAIWLDLDRRMSPALLAHLEHYHITEDIAIRDLSDAYERIAVLGPNAAALLAKLAVEGAANWPLLASREVMLTVDGSPLTPPPLQARSAKGGDRPEPHIPSLRAGGLPIPIALRSDFPGVFAVELLVPTNETETCWNALVQAGALFGARPVGHSAVDAARIEAGIPASVSEINEGVLPAETLQTDRAVDYKKGCYLGQEVIERMRTRGGLARQLVVLRLAEEVQPPATLYFDALEVGQLTSACHSFALSTALGLGYVKVAQAELGTKLRVVAAGREIAAEVVRSPLAKA